MLPKVHYTVILRYREVINRMAQGPIYDRYKFGANEKIMTARASRLEGHLALKIYRANRCKQPGGYV